MSFRVLLADDEPLILSGIKFLIDWEKNDCQVVGTARNGQQTLDFIQNAEPDIVVCDIHMPVLSGIDVLQTVSEAPNAPVFIMLTNYQEFDLARQSLRLKAVDYLLKSQLEAPALERSLTLAKEECLRRGSLAKIQLAQTYLESNRGKLVAENMKKLLCTYPKDLPGDYVAALQAQGVTENFCLIQLMMDFSPLPTLNSFTSQERNQLYAWEQEVVEKLAGNLFPGFCAFDPDGTQHSLVLFCWNIPSGTRDWLSRFYSKLCAASENITQTRLALTATQVFPEAKHLEIALSQFMELGQSYYFTQCAYVVYENLPHLDLQPLHCEELGNKFALELRSRNVAQWGPMIDKITDSIYIVPHGRNDGQTACATLYSVAAMVLLSMLPEGEVGDFFLNTTLILEKIRGFITKDNVVLFLKELKQQISVLLEQMTEGKSDITEKARCYILENVDRRIMLQDVANYVNISPGYLSSLFKKEFNQNLIDFINATKMERACALIREGKYRIYEISYMLSFENAYYFTKVFKKHTGLTPTEFQRKLKKEK